MPEPTMRLSVESLAELSGALPELIVAMRDAGLLEPGPDGLYQGGDVHRVRIVGACVDAGIPLDALAASAAEGGISFEHYDQMHPQPGPLTARTYQESITELPDEGAMVRRLLLAVGLAEPAPHSRLRQSDEDWLIALADMVSATGTPDLGLRAAWHLAEAQRRATEALLGTFVEAVEQVAGDLRSVSSDELWERFLRPWTGFARAAPDLARWLMERHLSVAIDAFTIARTEAYLANVGYVPTKSKPDPTIAFIDLVDYTKLAEEQGDEAAAKLALEFGSMAASLALRHAGRVVKLLGDGVLLRFDSTDGAGDASLAILAELKSSGLTLGHAGMATGRVIERDGDVFGTTVNLASRLATAARPDALYATSTGVGALDPQRFITKPIGSHVLKGFATPSDLVRVEWLTTPDDEGLEAVAG